MDMNKTKEVSKPARVREITHLKRFYTRCTSDLATLDTESRAFEEQVPQCKVSATTAARATVERTAVLNYKVFLVTFTNCFDYKKKKCGLYFGEYF